MAKKTRDPLHDLNHNEYVPWLKDVDKYLVNHSGDPAYPAELHARLTPLIAPLEAAINDYQTKKDDEDAASTDYTAGYEVLVAKMRLARNLLPTIIDDPSVPAEFSLAEQLPNGRDELAVRAQAFVTNWEEVCDPAVPPEYASLEALFNEIVVLFGDYSTLKDAYSTAYYAMVDAQNTLLEAREACNEAERDIFHWFRGFHPKGDDEFWTETPWGCVGESEPEQLPAVTGLALDYEDPNLTVTWDEVAGADGYKLIMGNNPTILTTTLYVGPETSYTFDPPGGHHYFRVWAMKGDDLGERGDYVEIEIEGVPPAKPHGLKVKREGGYLKWEWKSGEVPQYYRLYIAIVDTGSPEPSMPDEPEHDELITLSVSTFAPESGKTVYGWVTAFGDGAESDADGPVRIDIV